MTIKEGGGEGQDFKERISFLNYLVKLLNWKMIESKEEKDDQSEVNSYQYMWMNKENQCNWFIETLW